YLPDRRPPRRTVARVSCRADSPLLLRHLHLRPHRYARAALQRAHFRRALLRDPRLRTAAGPARMGHRILDLRSAGLHDEKPAWAPLPGRDSGSALFFLSRSAAAVPRIAALGWHFRFSA